MPISIMPICPKLPAESGPALGTLSMCLKTGITPTSMTESFKEGPVLKEPAITKLTLGQSREMSSFQLFAEKTLRYTATSETPAAWGNRSISVVRSAMRRTALPPGAGKTTAITAGTQAAPWTLRGPAATITPKVSQKTTTRPSAMIHGDLPGDAFCLPPHHPIGGPPSTLSVCAGRAAKTMSFHHLPCLTALPCLCT